MDPKRHRLLTECIDYFQENLEVTWELVHRCVDEGIFSIEEGTMIWSEESNLGKSLELIYLLRKKDDAAYDKFIAVLKIRRKKNDKVIGVLNYKQIGPGARNRDPATEIFLNQALQGVMIRKDVLFDLAAKLVLKQKNTDTNRSTGTETGSGACGREKEELKKELKTLEEQYEKLKRIATRQQKEIEECEELNSLYEKNIQMLRKKNREERKEHEEKEDEINAVIQKLEQEKSEISDELDRNKEELDNVNNRVETIRKMVLKNKSDATIDDLEKEIEKLVEVYENSEDKKALLNEVQNLKRVKGFLEREVKRLEREQDRITFELRNEVAKMTRVTGKKSIEPLFFTEGRPGSRYKVGHLPPLESPRESHGMTKRASKESLTKRISKESLTKRISKERLLVARPSKETISRPNSVARSESPDDRPRDRPKTSVKMYCVLCRSMLKSSDIGPCSLHRDEFKEGTWSCCRRGRNGKGCKDVAKHCFLSKDKYDDDILVTFDKRNSLRFE